MIAPCSVKANGNDAEYLSRARWSQFATTSVFSWAGQLDQEVRRKTFPVSPHLLVEPFGRDAVERRQIGIQHHFLSSNQ